MKSSVNKYRTIQKAGDTISSKKKSYKSAAILIDTNGDVDLDMGMEEERVLFDDKVIISEAASERLAQEAVTEDLELELAKAELELNKEIENKNKIVRPVIAQAPTTATSKDRNRFKPKEGAKKLVQERETLGTRDEIIQTYAPLIKYIAQKIAARLPANIELDDLISSGVIGLMDAIDKYDSSRDNKFKTYAEFRIRGAILDELRAQDWVPRSVREKAKTLERAFARIEQNKGSPANEDEVCAELNISKAEYHELLSEVRSVSLLSFEDLGSPSKGDKYNVEFSENGKAPTPFSEVNSSHVKKIVAEAIGDLPEKQRLVLSLYYYEDLNLKEIGKVLDVTESRVSQLHTQAIIRLKSKLKGHFDEFVNLFS